MYKSTIEINQSDIDLWKKIINPESKTKKKITLLFSFTHVTFNYWLLYRIKSISSFINSIEKDVNVIFIFLDVNMMKWKTALNESMQFETEQSYINFKVNEFKKLAISLGIPEQNLIVKKASEVWERMTMSHNQKIFLKIYDILASIETNEINPSKRISEIFQMTSDLFISNFYDVLFPEDANDSVDILCFSEANTYIYSKVREIMFDKGFISYKKPIFSFMKRIPFYIHNGLVPEWNMKHEEIEHIIENSIINNNDTTSLLESFALMNHELKVVYKNQVQGLSKENIVNVINKIDIDDIRSTISLNMYEFLKSEKTKTLEKLKSFVHKESSNLQITELNKSQNIGRILKADVYREILKFCDGTNTITQIARKSEKQIANVSIYISHLKESGIIKISNDGKPIRIRRSITINLDTII